MPQRAANDWQVFLSRQGWYVGRICEAKLQKQETYFKTLEEARKELDKINADKV